MEEDRTLKLIKEAKANSSINLNLSSGCLVKLPPEIEELNHLEVLDLSDNLFETIPNEIFQLKKLRVLRLSRNLIRTVSEEIKTLENIIELDLSLNHLAKVPLEITHLRNLQVVNLSENLIRRLPPEIERWKVLKKLDLHLNKLITINSAIGKLNNLEYLDCSLNNLNSIPIEIFQLKSISYINLSKNKIKYIPSEITELNSQIVLADNPLEVPPLEIVSQGKYAIIEYFKSLENDEYLLNELKVLFVGEGSAGKTSLVKRIVGENFNQEENQTHGIDIRKWRIKDIDEEVQINFWDFGGQEIMHATHQFFLSKRSLYIVVLDGRKDEKVEYWLKHIESFGGSSSILIVINKIDQNSNFEVNRKFLQDKYPSVKGFYRVSCKTGEGINLFIDFLKKQVRDVEHLKTTWPKSWFNVKRKIEGLNENFISYEIYKQICDEENIKQKISQDTLIDFLHDLGIALHFRDFELLDTHVLEPKWVTNAVYKIINSKELSNKKGVLKLSSLDSILEKKGFDDYYYPVDKYQYIIDLMKKFELCYYIDPDTILIPELLQIEEPDFMFNKVNTLSFEIDYMDFLPKSVMPRFIVKMHEDIKDELRWRTGVVLENKSFKTLAVIKSDEDTKKIYISVSGKQKREYFSIILNNFRRINQSFTNLEAVERIPLPDKPDITVSYEHLITLEHLGEKTYIPEGTGKKYSVKDLLGSVYVESIIPTKIQYGDTIIGDKHQYWAEQVIGAQGPNAQGNVNVQSLNQIWQDYECKIDFSKLVEDLKQLKAEMKNEADSPEQFESVTNIAHAQEFAEKKDGKETLKYLSKAGKWSLGVAEKLGVGVAIEALKVALGY